MTNTPPVIDTYLRNIDNVDKALACFADGAEFTTPTGPVPFPEGLRQMLEGYHTGFPGQHFEVKSTVQQGDDVAVEGFWVGKHTGPMTTPDGRTIPATGKEVRAPFVAMYKLKDGKIASHHGYWDLAGFMSQLGVGQA